jgi:Arc/MetJ family transcription regulator
MMRTTLTLDDQLAKSLQERARQSRQSFKEVVNQALRLGLSAMDQPPPPATYRLKAASMGRPRIGIDIDKALVLANQMEDDALASKLEMRK